MLSQALQYINLHIPTFFTHICCDPNKGRIGICHQSLQNPLCSSVKQNLNNYIILLLQGSGGPVFVMTADAER